MMEVEYGLDYAMHVHNIERIEKVTNEHGDMINDKIALGWKPLQLDKFYHASGVPFLIAWMGVPRPKICMGNDRFFITHGTIGGDNHAKFEKIYDHETDVWYCPKCAQSIYTRNLGIPCLINNGIKKEIEIEKPLGAK